MYLCVCACLFVCFWGFFDFFFFLFKTFVKALQCNLYSQVKEENQKAGIKLLNSRKQNGVFSSSIYCWVLHDLMALEWHCAKYTILLNIGSECI